MGLGGQKLSEPLEWLSVEFEYKNGREAFSHCPRPELMWIGTKIKILPVRHGNGALMDVDVETCAWEENMCLRDYVGEFTERYSGA